MQSIEHTLKATSSRTESALRAVTAAASAASADGRAALDAMQTEIKSVSSALEQARSSDAARSADSASAVSALSTALEGVQLKQDAAYEAAAAVNQRLSTMSGRIAQLEIDKQDTATAITLEAISSVVSTVRPTA